MSVPRRDRADVIVFVTSVTRLLMLGTTPLWGFLLALWLW